jgi:hypothetical protein
MIESSATGPRLVEKVERLAGVRLPAPTGPIAVERLEIC